MNEFLAEQILKYRDFLKVPLKYVDKKQAKAGTYIPVRERDENNFFVTRHMTVDEEKYAEFCAENDHKLSFIMLKDIKTIKKCVLFITCLVLIDLSVRVIVNFLQLIGVLP